MAEAESRLRTLMFPAKPVFVPRLAYCKRCGNRARRGFVATVHWIIVEPWMHTLPEHDDHVVDLVVFEPPAP
jgi:hypothetical protein